MTKTPLNLYHRQDKNTPEKLMLERLEIILNKFFKQQYEGREDYTDEDMEEAYHYGTEEVKEYLRDTLQLYCYEKGVQDDR